jgi:hypothetical protein
MSVRAGFEEQPMAEDLGTGTRSGSGRHSRRAVLGVAATLGVLAPAAPAALAATVSRRPAEVRPEKSAAEPGDAAQAAAPPRSSDAAPDGDAASELWGASASGDGAGVRGNGRIGIVGEGTHAGVTGDGFVGVRGTTSLLEGDQRGVGVLAESVVPGSTALRTDGPSEFNGVTRFARSGVTTVPAGSSRVTVRGVELTETSAILATLQRRASGVHLDAVETNSAAASFTIYLTAASPRELPVAWFVLG